jgi:hypothetical protein
VPSCSPSNSDNRRSYDAPAAACPVAPAESPWRDLGEGVHEHRNEALIDGFVDPVIETAHNITVLDRPRIWKSLIALDDALISHPFLAANPGEKASLRVVGGAAIILRHGSRIGTTDIDAAIWPERGILEMADGIAQSQGLGLGWLNDAAKRFLPEKAEFIAFAPPVPLRRITLALADDQTLLAMKCHALRGAKDSDDIIVLARSLQMRSALQIREHTNYMYGRVMVDVDAAAILEEVVHGRL